MLQCVVVKAIAPRDSGAASLREVMSSAAAVTPLINQKGVLEASLHVGLPMAKYKPSAIQSMAKNIAVMPAGQVT